MLSRLAAWLSTTCNAACDHTRAEGQNGEGWALVLEQHEYAYDEDWTVRVDDRRAHYDRMRA